MGFCSPGSSSQRRIETWTPEARYCCPILPRGENSDFTFVTVVSAMVGPRARGRGGLTAPPTSFQGANPAPTRPRLRSERPRPGPVEDEDLVVRPPLAFGHLWPGMA